MIKYAKQKNALWNHKFAFITITRTQKETNTNQQAASYLSLSMFLLEEWIGEILFKIPVGLLILHKAQHPDMCC